jgi:hypothetical protein
MSTIEEKRADDALLLERTKERLPQLEKLLTDVNDHWCYEDGIYRFYHQSFKVCYLQVTTIKIVAALRELWPDRPLNPWFQQIIDEGAGTAKPPPGSKVSQFGNLSARPLVGGAMLTFDHSWNKDWLRHTRPIVEAFMHAKFMLEMAVKYGQELETAPDLMPSGWAALLYLYDAR